MELFAVLGLLVVLLVVIERRMVGASGDRQLALRLELERNLHDHLTTSLRDPALAAVWDPLPEARRAELDAVDWDPAAMLADERACRAFVRIGLVLLGQMYALEAHRAYYVVPRLATGWDEVARRLIATPWFARGLQDVRPLIDQGFSVHLEDLRTSRARAA